MCAELWVTNLKSVHGFLHRRLCTGSSLRHKYMKSASVFTMSCTQLLLYMISATFCYAYPNKDPNIYMHAWYRLKNACHVTWSAIYIINALVVCIYPTVSMHACTPNKLERLTGIVYNNIMFLKNASSCGEKKNVTQEIGWEAHI